MEVEEEEAFILACMSQPSIEESRGRSKAGTKAESLEKHAYWITPTACSACFGSSAQGITPPTVT